MKIKAIARRFQFIVLTFVQLLFFPLSLSSTVAAQSAGDTVTTENTSSQTTPTESTAPLLLQHLQLINRLSLL